jgi:hypothetical protein
MLIEELLNSRGILLVGVNIVVSWEANELFLFLS